MNENYCCPPKPDKKEPFPAMSAHFAHTLADMKDKYLEAQYITIDSEVGTLDPEILKKLLFSRSNMVVYQNRIFRFANQEGYLCKYINLYNLDTDNFYKAQQVNIDSLTGSWQVVDLESDSKSEIITVEEQVVNIQNEINDITENITNLTTEIDTEINARKVADEQIIQDTTTSFNAVKDELEVMDDEVQNVITNVTEITAKLEAEIETREEVDAKTQTDIEALEAGFETVDEALEKMEDSVTNVTAKLDNIIEKVDNIGQSLTMDGGEIVIVTDED